MNEIIHVPVMVKEIVESLNVKEDGVYVDMTVGMGGHASALLFHSPHCTIVAVDKDEQALSFAKERLKGYSVHFVNDRFSNIKNIIHGLAIKEVDGIIVDPGLSAVHLHSPERGFSFLADEPLDMRMDQRQFLTARQVVNTYSQEQLMQILWDYGEERFSKRIARAIITVRRKKAITTCQELADIVKRAVPGRKRIHPATRTFQALRIEVNNELEELQTAIENGVEILKKGGVFCALSYHSLEDRIIKHRFKSYSQQGLLRIKTKKPLTPTEQEKKVNSSSRSAKLRIGEKV